MKLARVFTLFSGGPWRAVWMMVSDIKISLSGTTMMQDSRTGGASRLAYITANHCICVSFKRLSEHTKTQKC